MVRFCYNDDMDPDRQLADALFIQKVLRARRTPPEKKYLAGARLFEYTRRIAHTAIQAENPQASPEQIRDIFRQRRKITRFLEEHPL
jgi:uncharacterized membrane protein